MAYGTEIWLGWVGVERWGSVAEELKVTVAGEEDRFDFEKRYDLKQEHKDSLVEAGFQFKRMKNYHVVASTPLGDREFSPFAIGVHYDPDEMGMEPDQAVFGVALSGRYYPRFLDWKDPHGGIDCFELDDLNHMIEIARKHISNTYPIFSTAHVVIVSVHY